MQSDVRYQLQINGSIYEIDQAWLGESLLYVLRERLQLMGAKNACEQGECGSCSVLVDGELVCACLVMAATAEGSDIHTIEGLGADGQLSPVQKSFVECGAIQCGFCTPGLIMSLEKFLSENSDPSDLELREAISGNLCRCTGYGRILEAARSAAVSIRTNS
jgi:aerobic carbon-monoxide dehydrogenase small subunit